jgi:hypothetical protein
MAIAIQPYTEERIEAVKAFNRRLVAGGVAPEFQFPENNIPGWLPRHETSRIYQQYYLAVENETVRGGFILKYQDFSLRGETRPIAYYHLPVSEGIVNKAYTGVGALMLRSALKMEPMLFALGMGGFDRPLPTMLKALGWSMFAVPFHYKIIHPSRFLRNIAPMWQPGLRKMAADIAALSGTGWAAIKIAQWLRTRSAVSDAAAQEFSGFDSWAGELWQRCSSQYSFIASRDTNTLQRLYPPDDRFIPLKVLRGSQLIGWAVVLDTQMRNNKYFGNLRVGSIVDCLSAVADAHAVVQTATRVLEKRGVDLIVCNNSHAKWSKAFRLSGYFLAASNFIFAASPALAKELAPFESNRNSMYLMRGDGDGPVNL